MVVAEEVTSRHAARREKFAGVGSDAGGVGLG